MATLIRNLLVIVLLAGSQAFAETPFESSFKQGRSLETAKQYRQALSSYSQAFQIAVGPQAALAARQMGNCYYYLGAYDRALSSYRYYLRAYPADQAVARLAQRLEIKLGQPALPPAGVGLPTAEATGAKASSRVYLFPLSATWRSMIIPGLGQFERGSYVSAASYFGAFALTTGTMFYLHSVADKKYEDYTHVVSSSDDATKAFQESAQMDGLYNASLGLILGIYLVNVLDALIVTAVTNPPAPPTAPASDGYFGERPSLALEPRYDGFAVSLRLTL